MSSRGTTGHISASVPSVNETRPPAMTASEPIARLSVRNSDVNVHRPSTIAYTPNNSTATGSPTPGTLSASPNRMARPPRTAIIHALRASVSIVMAASGSVDLGRTIGLLFGHLRHRRLGQQQEARRRHRVLERHTHDLRGIDDAGLDEVDVLLACG